MQFWVWSGVLSLRWGSPWNAVVIWAFFCGEDRQHSVDSQRDLRPSGLRRFLNTMQEEHGCSSHIAKSSDGNMAYLIHSRIPPSLLLIPNTCTALQCHLFTFYFSFSWVDFLKRVLQLNRMSNKTDIIDVWKVFAGK